MRCSPSTGPQVVPVPSTWHAVVDACEIPSQMTYSRAFEGTSIEDKLDAVARKVYHADGVDFVENAPAQLKVLRSRASAICRCGWQDAVLVQRQPGLCWVRRATSAFRCATSPCPAGAGFIVALTGDIMTMPGLSKVPSAEKIDVDSDGKITGLF